jgi:hypothetical protein
MWRWVALASGFGLLAWMTWRRRFKIATTHKITLDPVSENWLIEQRRQK